MRQLLLPLLLCAGQPAQCAAQELRNWFNDPFFAVSNAISGCPEPAGPRVTESERLAQSHRRAEKGTTCWLAGEKDCARSSAFTYDAEIAESIKSQAKSMNLAQTSLWVTVQGRVVYIEGCSLREGVGQELESVIRVLPGVQQALSNIAVGASPRPTYRVFSTLHRE